MNILFEFNEREIAFLTALSELGGKYTNEPKYEDFRTEWKEEINSFTAYGLIGQTDPEGFQIWNRHGLTTLGVEAARQHDLAI